MGPCRTSLTLLTLAFVLTLFASAQKIKVVVDQDARGPGTSDQQAILVFLQSDKFDIDAEKFYKLYIDLMTRPPRK